MAEIGSEGEAVVFQCSHCGGPVRQNLRRFEAGVRDPICPSCLVQIKFSNEDRAKIIEDHNRLLSAKNRRHGARRSMVTGADATS